MIDWTAITAVIGSVTTLGGTLGGYWFAGRNDEARDKRADRRESRARRTALAERLEEERHTFQRDTFLELQDLLLELARWRALVNEQDMKIFREQGRRTQLPVAVGGDEGRLKFALAEKLESRVLDRGLRAAIGVYIDACGTDPVGGTDMDAQEATQVLQQRNAEIGILYEEVTKRLGEHLRRELDRRILVDELDRA